MKYLKPRKPSKVDWTISDQTLCIIEQYAKFSDFPPELIVEDFMKNLLGNPEFAQYLRGLRRNKRMVDRIFHGDEEMNLLRDYMPKNAGGPQLIKPYFAENQAD